MEGMSRDRAIEMVWKLTDALLDVTDDAQMVTEILGRIGFTDDEMTQLGFEI